MITLVLQGQWSEASRIALTMQAKFVKALEQATLREGQFLRGHMVRGIASQAPGGRPFKPLSPLTLALRRASGFGGSKALIRTGALRAGITALRVPGSSPKVFVGILRSARAGGAAGGGGGKGIRAAKPVGRRVLVRGAGGKFVGSKFIASKFGGGGGGGGSSGGAGGMSSLANIGAIQEFGATIRRTTKMLRFLMAKMRAAGITSRGGGGSGKKTFTIPPRPFIQPILDVYAKPADVKRRFYMNVANAMDGDLGRVVGARI